MPSSPTDYSGKHYRPYIHGKYSSQIEYNKLIVAMVLKDAEKIFKRLAKELDEEIITNASNTGSLSLPLLPSFDEQEKTNV
jgi:uncharacterized protein YjgD (DUF1641 family)